MTNILNKVKGIFNLKGEEPKNEEIVQPPKPEEKKGEENKKEILPPNKEPEKSKLRPTNSGAPKGSAKKPNLFLWILIFSLIFMLIWGMFFTSKTYVGDYAQFEAEWAAGTLKNVSAEWYYDYYIRLYYTASDGKYYVLSFDGVQHINEYWDSLPTWGDPSLETPQLLINYYNGPGWFWTMISTWLPWILVMVIAWVLIKKVTEKQQGVGKIQKKSLTPQISNVKFKNVAGYKDIKQELVELVDFLKQPLKYQAAGARTPKGILLAGPPGTGKTLFAKAVAGEAGIPFYSISGSDFVEMFVGVGASRVRALFEAAKATTPSLIFIDELDAVGRMRGAGIGGGNDEREQTLNQLLVELDGFQQNSGVLVMAATNRPDVLDPALKRPGRFDRSVELRLPDIKERQWILESYANVGNKQFSKDVNWQNIASRTPGFSGAELENVMNEAAILSIRTKTPIISVDIIDEAIDRVIGGPSKLHNTISPEEKNLIAHHEAGHALIGLIDSNAEKVQKISIVPRGAAGGYVLMTPKKEKFVQTKSELLSKITSYMGGRVAEEIFFGKNEITTGASNDIQQATAIARKMVTQFGMSELGPIQYEKPEGSVFLGRDMSQKEASSKMQHEVDIQIKKIIDVAYSNATTIIENNKEMISLFAKALIIKETLNSEETEEIFKSKKIPDAILALENDKTDSANPNDKPAAKNTTQKEVVEPKAAPLK